MATLAQQTAIMYQRLVDVWHQSFGCDQTATTLDLYRRNTRTAVSDLGIPTDPWQRIVTAQPCTIIGIKQHAEGAFELREAGQVQHLMLEVMVDLQDVRAGDNVFLTLTGQVYHVERAEPMGPLYYLLLDHALAQVKL